MNWNLQKEKKTEKLETTTITVDVEVWKELISDKKPRKRDSLNKVLRRRLGLEPGTIVVIGLTEYKFEETTGSFVTVDGMSLITILNKLFKGKTWIKKPKKVRLTIEDVG